VKTEHLKWDKLTGQPVLSLVNNNFDDALYSYNRLAYNEYRGMGPSYHNLGLWFELNNIEPAPYRDDLYNFNVSDQVKPHLFPGDEIILQSKEDGENIGLAVYLGEENGSDLLFSDESPGESFYYGLIVRSGRRNQLSVSAGSIVAKEDPSSGGTPTSFTKTIEELVESEE
jgi:hypothetical protein